MNSEDVTWQQLVEAESHYIALRMALHRSGRQVEELRQAFKSRRGADMALNYLRDVDEELLRSLLPEIVEMAMTTDSQIPLTREVLSRVEPAEARKVTWRIAGRVLDRVDVVEQDYRKIFSVLSLVGDDEGVRQLIEHADNSADPGIRSLAQELALNTP